LLTLTNSLPQLYKIVQHNKGQTYGQKESQSHECITVI